MDNRSNAHSAPQRHTEQQQQQPSVHPDPRQLMPTLHHSQHDRSPDTASAHPQRLTQQQRALSPDQHRLHQILVPQQQGASSDRLPLSRSLPEKPSSRSISPPAAGSSTASALSNALFTTSQTLTSATGHFLAVPKDPPEEKSRLRRWSMTGRYFGRNASGGGDKEKDLRKTAHDGAAEVFRIPGSKLPQELQATHQRTDSTILRDSGGDPTQDASQNTAVGNHSNNTANLAKQISPSGSRRPSLVEFPRSFWPLSSWRRSSAASAPSLSAQTNDPSYTANSSAMAAATAAVSASIAAAMGTSPSKSAGYGNTLLSGVMRDELSTGYLSAHDRDIGARSPGGWLGEQPVVTMATLKAPPMDAATLARRPPPKSILKKRASDGTMYRSRERAPGVVTSAALAGAGPRGTGSANSGSSASTVAAAESSAGNGDGLIAPSAISAASAGNGSRTSSILSSVDGNVHPMAAPDMGDGEAHRIFTPPTDHRARLVTHSPPPTHPQQHLAREPSSSPPSSEPSSSEDEEEEEDQDEENEEGSHISPTSRPVPTVVEPVSIPSTSHNTADSKIETAAATATVTSEPYSSAANGPEVAPDITPGVQSNNSLSYRSLGAVNHDDNDLSQAELLNNEMISVSARAQELAKQYYGSSPDRQGVGRSGKGGQQPGQLGQRESAQGKKRSIGFSDRIEIIPVYRKSEYNRQSDKHATFRILTPELKSEIRDELNAYKMREMAVHVDSMGNTAFH